MPVPILELIPGPLFVRVRTRCSYEFALVVRTLFARCSYEFAYAARALFVRCSYAARTSSHERELTRELRGAPLCGEVYGRVVGTRNQGTDKSTPGGTRIHFYQ